MDKDIEYYLELLDQLQKIPTIGKKASERIFDALLTDKTKIDLILNSLTKLKNDFLQCDCCFTLKIKDKCVLCDNEEIDKTKICIVSNIRDYFAIAKSKLYKYSFHVLNGEINLKKGISPDKLTIDYLIKRIAKQNVKEIIFALNGTFEGEVTLAYLKKIIQEQFPDILLTRISQGLPLGGMIEYIDDFTLKRALEDRKKV